MNYLFRDEWHEVPLYTAYPRCRLVAVCFSIPLARIEPRDQRVMERNWRKVWQFIAVEGFTETTKKIQSKRAQAELNGDFHLVLAAGTASDTPGDIDEKISSAVAAPPLLCLGTRHPQCAEVMLFRDELTVALPSLPEANLCARAAEEAARALGIRDDEWQNLGGYNFYSDETPPAPCVQFIGHIASLVAQRPSLEAEPSETRKQARFRAIYPVASQARSVARTPEKKRGAAVIGAGDYVRTHIAPALKRSGIPLHTVVDLEPYLAAYVKEKFGFLRATTNWRDAVCDPAVDPVVIATYHDSHAEIAACALRHGKKVLVEKPPTTSAQDLTLLAEAATMAGAFLEVGYNRRYAPLARQAKRLLEQHEEHEPTTIICIVKEVPIPDEHWYRWPKEGTRITGNICHWIDLAVYFLGLGRQPVEMTVTPQADRHKDGERSINILFRNRSSVTIIATGRGDSTLGVQEYIEIRRGDLTIKIDDFRKLIAMRAGQTLLRARSRRDKGHTAMYKEALENMVGGRPASYTLEELRLTTLLTIHATEMVKKDLRHTALNF